MTTQTKALKMALEALEPVSTFGRIGSRDVDTAKAQQAITAIKEVLAQPAVAEQHKQEPVAWIVGDDLTIRADWVEGLNWKGSWVDVGRAIPNQWTPVLYTTPPQRTWVGLTDDERKTIAEANNALVDDDLFDEIEAKLKEKNT